jgi:hypothetical protein
MNVGQGTYEQAVHLVQKVREAIPHAIEVEMRFIEPDGSLRY